MAYREDIGSLSKATRLDNGRVIVDAIFTKADVFTYLNPDGSLRLEYRPPDEVFAKRSMDSLALVPFTDLHPPEMVTADNSRTYTVGQVGENIRRDGISLAGKIAINDARTIAKMDAGEAELSCGYDCDLELTPGITPDGKRYDAIQRNIVYNHVARVPEGRAGTARARMDERLKRVSRADAAMQMSAHCYDGSTCRCDAACSCRTNAAGCSCAGGACTCAMPADRKDHSSAALSAPSDTRTNRTDSIKENQIMNLEQALAALAAANVKIGELGARADAADKKADKNKAERVDNEKKLVKAEADLAAEKARADEATKRAETAEKARTDAAQNFDARVQARANLFSAAVSALGRNDKGEILSSDGKTTIKLDAMIDRDIRALVVQKLDGVTVPATRGDEAVSYAYDLAIERASKAGKALATAREVIVTHNVDAKDPPKPGDAEAEAKARMDARRNTAWKPATSKEGK